MKSYCKRENETNDVPPVETTCTKENETNDEVPPVKTSKEMKQMMCLKRTCHKILGNVTRLQ